MTRSTAPVDQNGVLIQALRLLPGGSHEITIGATSTRNTTPFDANTRAVEVFADANCRIRQGDNTVTALTTDSFFPSGAGRIYSVGGDKQAQYAYFAVIRHSGSSGTFYISELE